MRIVGLPEFGGSVRRPGAPVNPTERVAASQKAASQARQSEAPVATSSFSAGAEAPVDHERVAQIRQAIESGTYPLLPAKIADAFIAARLYGKIGQ
ncbi:flagellar biosynthesis anti-sigma factor FlgM [Qipengyuania sp. MTN3-11]|uniref:flagellar biosynthesis anti-sigma factor FlgM n=1 Tax=Qipengyuania sp. MTN3-11 TaxID=3056557 RepID=UPI0036F2AF7C